MNMTITNNLRQEQVIKSLCQLTLNHKENELGVEARAIQAECLRDENKNQHKEVCIGNLGMARAKHDNMKAEVQDPLIEVNLRNTWKNLGTSVPTWTTT